MGYWQTVAILLTPLAAALILLYVVNFGPLAWPTTLALIIAPLYYLNKSRNHNLPQMFDDKLTEQRIRTAREQIIAEWKIPRED